MLTFWITASVGASKFEGPAFKPKAGSTSMPWTEAQIAELERLWTAGQSASQIGMALGVSKNAVIGKAHRLNLPVRASPIRRESKPKQAKRKLVPKKQPRLRRRLLFEPGPQRHGSPSCLWPIGDPANIDFHFCGNQTVAGRPYCAEHCARAYLPDKRNQSKAA